MEEIFIFSLYGFLTVNRFVAEPTVENIVSNIMVSCENCKSAFSEVLNDSFSQERKKLVIIATENIFIK
jgi:hypothetical protein